MTTIKANLQQLKLSSIPADVTLIKDERNPSFSLRIGKKLWTWRINQRIKGQRGTAPYITFGAAKALVPTDHPILKPIEAYRQFVALQTMCKAGCDPRTALASEQEQAKREANTNRVTLRQLADHYYANAGRAEATQNRYRSIFKVYMAWAMDRCVTTIEDDELINVSLKLIAAEKAETQRKLLNGFGAMWNFGLSHFRDGAGQRILGQNPVRAIKAQLKAKRPKAKEENTPTINIHKVGEFIARCEQLRRSATATETGTHSQQCAANIALLCLFTGMRWAEAHNLKWEHVDFDEGSFFLPKTKTISHRIQMSIYVRELLEELKTKSGYSPYVFSHFNNPLQPIGNLIAYIIKLSDDMGYYFRLHSMRRAFKGVCNEMGVKKVDAMRMMNHSKGDTHDCYDRGDFNIERPRSHWQQVADFLTKKRDEFNNPDAVTADKIETIKAFARQHGLSATDLELALQSLKPKQNKAAQIHPLKLAS